MCYVDVPAENYDLSLHLILNYLLKKRHISDRKHNVATAKKWNTFTLDIYNFSHIVFFTFFF